MALRKKMNLFQEHLIFLKIQESLESHPTDLKEKGYSPKHHAFLKKS